MKKKLPGGRYRFVFSVIGLGLLAGVVLAFSGQVSSHSFLPLFQGESQKVGADQKVTVRSDGDTGTLEKMIVSTGNASLALDLSRLNGGNASARTSTINFTVQPDAFFTILAFNGEFRGTLPGSMALTPQKTVALPDRLNASLNQLVIESLPWGGDYDLAVRDAQTGYTFFNVEGQHFNYDATYHTFGIESARLLISRDFAADLGRVADAGAVVGTLDVTATMRPIEITQMENGVTQSESLPPTDIPENGPNPGPDVIVGDITGLGQFEQNGTQVGLAIGTDSCNAGMVDLNWFALPSNDHPVIPQNLYRMSGGANNDRTFEQVGQSSMKHAFTALAGNTCGYGCNGNSGTHLGSGCSDPYGSGLNAGPNLGSRAWVNPFTGFYPRGDSQTPPNNHSGHNHSGVAHTMRVDVADLNTTLNVGASYYAEGQYVTPHEYAWCQAHPTECNMFNNASYRKYTPSGTTSFSFSPAGATVRMQPAINAWPGATIVQVRPVSGDGVAFIAYKITNPSAGVWHYEYALYNMNLDRGIQSFILPKAPGVTLSNIGFHAPAQQPAWTFDGTFNNLGFSNTPWTTDLLDAAVVWSSETFAQNQNANAIRWGTMYNVRFDANSAPVPTTATVGFFKTGSAVSIPLMGPSANQGPPPCSSRRTNGIPQTGCGGGA
jgi:hypothetical protein